MIVVVMGVAGAGKSTVGQALAAALGAEFVEGDSYHPAANVEKMRAGAALCDADRWPWLNLLARALADWQGQGRDVVLACSALKEAYRAVLAAHRGGIHFVHLEGSEELIRARLDARSRHYMPATLLASQFASLEPPAAGEFAFGVDTSATPGEIVKEILARLKA